MRIGLAQINTVVGDLEGNVGRCLAAFGQARADGAELVVLPELAVTGCAPRDILYDPGFVAAVGEATADLARQAGSGPPVVVGTVLPSGSSTPGHPGLLNAAVLLERGEVRCTVGKRLLPAYDVFHETRWFSPGTGAQPVTAAGRRLGLLVGDDLADEGHPLHPAAELEAAGVEALVAIAASPFLPGVSEQRLAHARRCRRPLVEVNAVGGNDELLLDGRSFVVSAGGGLVAMLEPFSEEIRVVELEGTPTVGPAPLGREEELFRALELGVRDFANKNHIRRAFVGLSGGVDSALVAVIAAEALGPERVTAVAIPSRYTDLRSTECARELASSLGIDFELVELEAMHTACEASLVHLLGEGTAAENVQARLRALVLMAYVNRYQGMLLNTSNKTEVALGYGTLYGDMAGTLCPIGDLTKPDVVAVAQWLHSSRGLIPDFVLERPPSAELRPKQVDPFYYAKVAPAMEALVEANRSNEPLRRSEHKRWQLGVVLKVSAKSFGSGRLIPITRR